jgi:hypothetical protein
MSANDHPLRRDPSGQPALGITDPETDLLMPVYGDEVSGGVHVCLYKWNTSTLVWNRWDGRMDTIVSGDLIVAVDGLESLITASNVILATIDTAVDLVNTNLGLLTTLITDNLSTYGFANFDAASNPIYLGYVDKSGTYYVSRINTTSIAFGSIITQFKQGSLGL